MSVVAEIVEILVSGLTTMATGIGEGLSALASNVFLELGTNGDITGLSTFGQVVVAFGAVSLAVGLSTFVVKWVASLGARN